jgi:hypothetical protein
MGVNGFPFTVSQGGIFAQDIIRNADFPDIVEQSGYADYIGFFF